MRRGRRPAVPASFVAVSATLALATSGCLLDLARRRSGQGLRTARSQSLMAAVNASTGTEVSSCQWTTQRGSCAEAWAAAGVAAHHFFGPQIRAALTRHVPADLSARDFAIRLCTHVRDVSAETISYIRLGNRGGTIGAITRASLHCGQRISGAKRAIARRVQESIRFVISV